MLFPNISLISLVFADFGSNSVEARLLRCVVAELGFSKILRGSMWFCLGMRCAAHGICSNERLKCCAAVWAEHGPLSAEETSWLEGCRAGGQFVPLNVAQCASASTILKLPHCVVAELGFSTNIRCPSAPPELGRIHDIQLSVFIKWQI